LQIHPQFLDPDPAVISDLRFRRALYQGIDRRQLVDALLGGQSVVAESWLSPNDPPEYRPIESSIVRYPFNPAESVRLIQDLGYSRAQDGSFRDSAGQRLAVELRTVAVDINEKVILTVGDYGRQIGVAIEPVIVPPQRLTEMPFRAVFPGLELTRGAGDLGNLGWIHSRGARTSENNYRPTGGTNYPRYMNPELDALIDRFNLTIPTDERVRIGAQIIHHMTDHVVEMPLFYDTESTLIGKRVRNLTSRQLRSSHAWNAIDWDLE
jgi:ABC-type transport system substrate-binding protein